MNRLFKQNINTFEGLGDPGFDSEECYRLTAIRTKRTINFIKDCGINPKSILDVAGPSHVGKWIGEAFDVVVFNTGGNLDESSWRGNDADLVIMLEVLEHLLNPLLFMTRLKKLEFKDMIVSWPCRPSWLWTTSHFHEMRLDRFEYLCNLAGYEVVKVEEKRNSESWYNKFKGIRPFFRYFVNRQYLAHIRPI